MSTKRDCFYLLFIFVPLINFSRAVGPARPGELNLLPLDFDGSRVVAVIPAYNEERFISLALLKMRAYPLAMIVVDNGSSDGTALLAQAAGTDFIRHACNLGKGAALKTGLQAPRRLEPDVLLLYYFRSILMIFSKLVICAPLLGVQSVG